jgi:precorrin-3B C17-methyltransferase
LTVVSLGPGDPPHLVPAARQALAAADAVVGYQTYIDLIKPLLGAQEVVVSGMKAEVKRCRAAIDLALAGARVALVSSGDAGIYGMAGLALEILAVQGVNLGPPGCDAPVDLYFEVIPGVPALAAGAALLGAPLMHDFAVISLSDLLTPWDLIERRLTAAAQADFVIVVYNPKSKKRDWQLAALRDIVLRHRSPDTPVGIVCRAMREGQTTTATTLGHMLEHPVDMQTIVFIGNSKTYAFGPYLLTPRGYLDKYEVG